MDLSKILIDDPLDHSKPNVIFDNLIPTESGVSLDSIVEVITIEKDEPMPVNIVEQAPRYPGCKEKTEVDFKKCLNKKIVAFVSSKFNSGLNISKNYQGKQKIYVQFEIDKNGHIIDIEARSAHTKLEKEAIRVVGKLPKRIPGKQQNQNVSVRYNLPIAFYIK